VVSLDSKLLAGRRRMGWLVLELTLRGDPRCHVQLVSSVGNFLALTGGRRARLAGRDYHTHLVPLGVSVLHVPEYGLRRSIGSGKWLWPLAGAPVGLDGGRLVDLLGCETPPFPMEGGI
jgi:hypothetical protein